jgi:hypothetical protein
VAQAALSARELTSDQMTFQLIKFSNLANHKNLFASGSSAR